MKKVLIAFATREGHTAKVANRICERLSEAAVAVQLVDVSDTTQADDIDLGSVDLIVCGASMHAGGLESEMVDFLNRNKGQIEAKPRSFFLVLLSAATKDPELRRKWLSDAATRMNEQLTIRFDDCEMVAGALAYSKYSLPMRWVMKRIARQAGESTDTSQDYEYTDWNQVDRYARRLLDAL
jgi:menaquinone-dependent protoporphyrinogen oxidase